MVYPEGIWYRDSTPSTRVTAVPRFLRACAVFLLAAAVQPEAAGAQLRPIEPIPWDALSTDGPMLRFGVGYHARARAALAGTEGTLWEFGTYTATWTFGRVAVEVGGVVLRVFSDDSVYAAPIADARPSTGKRRVDTAEHRLSTIVLLTPPSSRADLVLRFGTRLPTTDNIQGLGRDQTDFFGSLGGRVRRGVIELAGEAGLGILSTRLGLPEQVDVLLYGARMGWGYDRFRFWLEGVGQHDTRHSAELRGLEDLGEARLVGEFGDERRIRVTLLRGWTRESVGLGIVVEGGVRFE